MTERTTIMARKVKAQGGPLDGKTAIVHENERTFTHHADTSGAYTVGDAEAVWTSREAVPPVAVDEVVEVPTPATVAPRTSKRKAARPGDAVDAQELPHAKGADQ